MFAITISLLTIACILVTFLAAFMRLFKNPPKLHITILPPALPERFNFTLQHVPADVEVKPVEEPIPEDILDYISQESEAHAQTARKFRVRALKRDTGSWSVAFRLLQREDNSSE